MDLIHATCIRYDMAGLLLCGPSGAGKSDLALRLLHDGGRLVGDDYVWVGVEDERLYAVAPETIAGQIEIRGIGIMTVPRLRVTELHAVIDLKAREEIERLPAPRGVTFAGLTLPAFDLDPFAAGAAAKVAAIVEVCKNPRRRITGVENG